MGTIANSLDDDDTIVILPSCTKSSDQIVTQIKALIETHKVTEAKFNSLKISEERSLIKSLEEGDNNEDFSVVRNVFKMFVQNDSSVYYQDRSNEDNAQSPLESLQTLLKSMSEEVASEEVLDAFRSHRN